MTLLNTGLVLLALCGLSRALPMPYAMPLAYAQPMPYAQPNPYAMPIAYAYPDSPYQPSHSPKYGKTGRVKSQRGSSEEKYGYDVFTPWGYYVNPEDKHG